MNPCIDYFCIVGPSGESNSPRIIAHLPKNVMWNKWDNEAQLGVLCLPQGCRERPSNQIDDTNFHSFMWTKEDSQISWAHSLEFWNPSGGLSHSIVMISTRPIILSVKYFLRSIYKYVLKDGVSLDSLAKLLGFFFCLTDSSSVTSVKLNNVQLCTMPPIGVPSVSLYRTFSQIPITKIIRILTSVLLERQVLILTSNLEELSLLSESLSYLLFPFIMPHTYIPLLPTCSDAESFLEAPVPYLMGVFSPSLSPGSLANLKAESAGRTIFDLDDNSLVVDDTLPNFPFETQLIEQAQSLFKEIHECKFKRLQQDEDHFSLHAANSEHPDEWIEDLKQNHKLSLPFRVAFGFMFAGYENFVIEMAGADTVEEWFQARDSMSNFDKVSFLSEQPEGHVSFLSTFLETQAFASYIDEKIRADVARKNQTETEPIGTCVARFDSLIARIRESHTKLDGELELPLSELVNQEFQTDPDGFVKTKHENTTVNTKEKPFAEFPSLHSAELLHLNFHPFFKRTEEVPEAPPPTEQIPLPSEPQAKIDPRQHYKFILKIIKDVNSLMKRILLGRLGREAATELGHTLSYSLQAEENVQIGQLCELLERIFRHGLKIRRSQSALWSFLVNFREYAPPGTWCAQPTIEVTPAQLSSSEEKSPGYLKFMAQKIAGLDYTRDISPPAKSPIADMNIISKMKSIQTDVGRARAWVRLAIEKRLLAHHLSLITSNPVIVDELYRKYGVLQCKEEWGQCLFHLLALGKTQDVEFHCFTHAYPTSGQTMIGVSETTANIYIRIVGEKGETGTVMMQNKTTLEVEFSTQNLGRLVTLTIGHDNSGMFPSWKVENVLVRNEVTGAVWNFPCGKRLGKSVGDGALERILPAERLGLTMSRESMMNIGNSKKEKSRDDLQQNLQVSVNKIQILLSMERLAATELNGLLCGEGGLVQSLSEIFVHGMKVSRIRTHFAWDGIFHTSVKVQTTFETNSSLQLTFLDVFNQVQSRCSDSGKEGKFQTFICVLLRDGVLSIFLPLIRDCCTDIYNNDAFLYDQAAIIFLEQMNRILETKKLTVDESLTKGIPKIEVESDIAAYESPFELPESTV